MKIFIALALSGLCSMTHAQTLPPTQAPSPQLSILSSPTLVEAIHGDWRSPENKARDQYRHPAETLKFFGVMPNLTVLEITPGAGWYTEILAPALRTSGKYIAAIQTDPDDEDLKAENLWKERINARPDLFSSTTVVDFPKKVPLFGPSNSVDVVLTFRNVHNWETTGAADATFKAMFDVLKPGGTLGVVEHRAKPGENLKALAGSGYLPESYVIDAAQRAGFKLEATSEVNANAKDTKDYVIGVWALPPTLGMGSMDREKLISIGESDRMTLRFLKPSATR